MNRFLITPVRNEALLLERFLEHHAPPFEQIVLTTRDRDSWLESMKWLFDDGAVLWKQGHVGDELHHRTYGTTLFDRVKLLAAWERHHGEVGRFLCHRDGDLLRLQMWFLKLKNPVRFAFANEFSKGRA
jgi:hypothetical protein